MRHDQARQAIMAAWEAVRSAALLPEVIVAGDPVPDVTGTLKQAGMLNGKPLFTSNGKSSIPLLSVSTRIFYSGSRWMLKHYPTGLNGPAFEWRAQPGNEATPDLATGWQPVDNEPEPFGTPEIYAQAGQEIIPADSVELENLHFNEPEGRTWYRLTLRPGETNRASLGGDNPMNRTVFLLILQVFIPEKSGSRDAYKAADIMAGLDGQQIATTGVTVHFQTATMEKATIPKTTPGSGWEAFNVTIPGHYDSTQQ